MVFLKTANLPRCILRFLPWWSSTMLTLRLDASLCIWITDWIHRWVWIPQHKRHIFTEVPPWTKPLYDQSGGFQMLCLGLLPLPICVFFFTPACASKHGSLSSASITLQSSTSALSWGLPASLDGLFLLQQLCSPSLPNGLLSSVGSVHVDSLPFYQWWPFQLACPSP